MTADRGFERTRRREDGIPFDRSHLERCDRIGTGERATERVCMSVDKKQSPRRFALAGTPCPRRGEVCPASTIWSSWIECGFSTEQVHLIPKPLRGLQSDVEYLISHVARTGSHCFQRIQSVTSANKPKNETRSQSHLPDQVCFSGKL